MSVVVSVQVTLGPRHLKQIASLTIVRGLLVSEAGTEAIGPWPDDVFEYQMVLDGVEYSEQVEHRYGDGVWELIRKCCEAIEEQPNWARDGVPLGSNPLRNCDVCPVAQQLCLERVDPAEGAGT